MRVAMAKVVRKEGKRILATRDPFTKPIIPPRLTAKTIDIQMGIPITANTTTAVPENATMAPREKSMPPTINTRVAPMLRMVKVLVCTRRLSTLRTVRKLCAKIEKIANITTRTPRVKSLFRDNLSRLRFNSWAGFLPGERIFHFPSGTSIICSKI